MSKGIMSKYASAFALILFLSFALLLAFSTVTVNRNAMEGKTATVTAASSATAECIQDKDALSEISDLSAFCDIYKRDICAFLDAIVTASTDDLSIFVVTNSGKIIITDNAKNDELVGKYIPKQIMDDVNSGVEIKSLARIEGVIDEKSIICATPIYVKDSYVCGTVFACARVSGGSGFSTSILMTLVITSVVVMMIAILAIYFITKRITQPLEEMRDAARKFAGGDFSVRVSEKGNDEIAELACAFNKMAESLASLEDMRNNFMSSVSHDMRTPMTTISGFIDCILSGAIPPEKHEYYLHVIQDEVKRLSRLVSTLLDISRIQAGDRKFVMAPFDICEMGRQVLISCEQRIDKKHLDVEFNIDDDNMYVMGDHDAIYQILYNICDNAIKFSYDGGLLSVRIKYLNENNQKKVSVSVFNEGEGIPLEDQPHIFERFYKSDRSRGKDKTGVGLGMFIAQTIIKAHGEEITLKSEPGKNCEFTFALPRAKAPERHTEHNDRAEE